MGHLEPALRHQSSESNLGVLGRRHLRIGVLLHVVLELAIQIRLRGTVTVIPYQYSNPFRPLCQISHYSTPTTLPKNPKSSTNRGPARLLLVCEPPPAESSSEASSASHAPSDSVTDECAHLVHSEEDLSHFLMKKQNMTHGITSFGGKVVESVRKYSNRPSVRHLPHVFRPDLDPTDSVTDKCAHLVHSEEDLSHFLTKKQNMTHEITSFGGKVVESVRKYSNRPSVRHLPHVFRPDLDPTASVRVGVSSSDEAVSAVAPEIRSAPETEMGRFPNKKLLYY